MSFKFRIAAYAALAWLSATSVPALADDHAFTEGPVVNIASIRTVDGKFDEYMQWVGTTWKQLQEASKKAGYIVSYQVLTVEARGPDDPDILLITTYKNWAALDGALAKGDALSKQIEGSVAKANQSQFERAKVRRVLGSYTAQELMLK